MVETASLNIEPSPVMFAVNRPFVYHLIYENYYRNEPLTLFNGHIKTFDWYQSGTTNYILNIKNKSKIKPMIMLKS